MSDVLSTDLVSRLNAYDKHNHRGKYAVLCREAAQEIERMRAYMEAIRDGAIEKVSYAWLLSMAKGALNNEQILVGEAGNYKQIPAEGPKAGPAIPRASVFPGTASMFASQNRVAVTTEWMKGWNACLDEIYRKGGFNEV